MAGIQNHTYRCLCQVLGLFALLLVVSNVHALAPEHETRRLMLATQEAVEEGNWQEASEYLNRLQALDTEKPPAYLYYRGKVMLESGFSSEARSALENYVQQAGEEGKHYIDTLKLITRIEQGGEREAQERGQGEALAVIEPAETENLDRLKQLYLAKSDAEALEIHLNTLLETAGWYKDTRVVQAGALPDIHYRVNAEQGQIKIQESRRLDPDKERERRLSTQTMQVYGVNPDVDWDCVKPQESCWIYDPRDGSRLFRLSHDSDRARQVARTFGQLIKELQTPD